MLQRGGCARDVIVVADGRAHALQRRGEEYSIEVPVAGGKMENRETKHERRDLRLHDAAHAITGVRVESETVPRMSAR